MYYFVNAAFSEHLLEAEKYPLLELAANLWEWSS